MKIRDKTALFSIFLVVFFDLSSFGMIIPLTPYLGQKFGANAFEIGLLLACYSFFQFLFNPFWGHLSDRLGRRPIILISLLGAAFSDLFFAYGESLGALFLARSLSGVFGGNVSAAFAYVADITEKKNRSISMGIIGVALGSGFILGPVLGGVGSDVGRFFGENPPLGDHFPALLASVLRFLTFIFSFFVLKESLSKENKPGKRSSRLLTFFEFLKRPFLRGVLLCGFLYCVSVAIMEASFFLFLFDRFSFSQSQASYSFAFVGFIVIFVEGFLIRKVIPRLKEVRTLLLGSFFLFTSLYGVPFCHDIPTLAIAIVFMGFGTGLFHPAFNGLLSLLASESSQGKVLGVGHSLSSLGRTLGPPLGGWVYYRVSMEASFFFASFVMVFVFAILFFVFRGKAKDDLF